MMYTHHDFHESYYEHGCCIIREKDVLDTDVTGSTFFVQIKRWWYDLFMLCCTDKRCIIYYNSTRSMQVERARHFRRHKKCIHPLSKFRIFWDAFISCILILHIVLCRHNMSVMAAIMPLASYFIGVLLECVLILDVYINTRCGYIDSTARKIVLDLHEAFKHYCSTKLFMHVASAIPLHSLMFIRYGMNIECAKCKCNTFNCVILLISVFSLLRIYEVSFHWARERDTFRATCFFRIIRIGILGMMTMQSLLTLSDTITMVVFLKTGHIEHSYIRSMLIIKFHNMPPSLAIFSFDCYRVFRLLLLFNQSFFVDKFSALIACAISYIFYIWGVVEVLSCVTQQYPNDQVFHNKRAVMGLAKTRQLPDRLTSKLQKYYDFNMTSVNIVEKQNGLYKSLPSILKKKIVMNCYTRMVMRIPYFSEWPTKVIESLTFLLKEEIVLQHGLVAEAGIPGDGLMIVDVGVMAVYSSDDHEIAHFIDGDYFGALSLITDSEIRTSYVVAVTNCKVLTLEKGDFRKFMRNHPDLFYEMKQRLDKKYRRFSYPAPTPISED